MNTNSKAQQQRCGICRSFIKQNGECKRCVAHTKKNESDKTKNGEIKEENK